VGFPGVYKIDVEQGNIVTQDMVEQLKPGMTRRQVRFILGTPLLEDPFNQDRWDYPYVKRNGLKVLSESRLMVYFDGDKLARFEEDLGGGSNVSEDTLKDGPKDGMDDPEYSES